VNVVDAVAGMFTSPVRTLRAIARDGANVIAPIGFLLLAVVLVEAKQLQRFLLLLSDGGMVIVHRIRDDILVADLRTHGALIVGAAVVAALLAQVLSKGKVKPQRAAIASLYLVVPLSALMCLGAFCDGVGLGAWWMPHYPVDSMVVVVGREVSWLRFVVKCVVTYAIPLGIGLTLVPWLRTPVDVAALSGTRRRIGVVVALVVVALGATGAVVSSIKYHDRIKPITPGDALPDAAMHRLDEFGVQKEKVKPSMFVGHVLVLDFWASWCAPCRRSMPELSKIYDEHKQDGLVVLGINREPEDPVAARKALKEIEPSFDCAIDERGYGERLGLTSLPTSYIVDKHGVVRHLHLGYTEPDVVEAEIKALLAE
jgi:thiol-disulfide isomerase/thioredoxin